MTVYLLTSEQAAQLNGIEFMPDNYFYPIKDINGNYVISPEEVQQCSIDWVKSLPQIEYEPIINQLE
jgi:hypothetical protein